MAKQGKSKKQMSKEQKQAALARKERVTKARKARHTKQEIAASRNRVSPEAAPWAVAKALRAARRHGVAGAA